MSSERRLQPLKRSPGKKTGTWADLQVPHPGVRDPRSLRMADWPTAVNVAVIASLTLITAFAILSATIASPVGPVREWERWTGASGTISLEHPKGWVVRNVGDGEHIHVIVVRSPWVRIHVISETGLLSAVGLYARPGDNESRYRLLELLHQTTADTWAALLGEDRLSEGRVGRTVISHNRAVWTEFKYSGRGVEGGEPMTGYRATILGGGREVLAGAVAPTQDWQEFKPIALRVLRSIRIGSQTRL